jgi:glucokinase
MTLLGGVDLGGTNVTLAVGRPDGTVEAERKMPTRGSEGPEAILERIALGLRDLSGGKPLARVGMGVPGLADLEAGVTKFLPNLPTQWRDVPVARILSAELGCDVRLLNDVRMATLGELAYGRGRDARTMAFFSVGTGVGGGVAIDGKLRLGPLGAAGEVGHQTILPDGPRCGCGNRGCLETLASAPALVAEGIRLLKSGLAPSLEEIVKGDLGAVTPEAMARSTDASIREAIERAGEYLGIGVANVVVILHPDLVVVGGGVSGLGEPLLSPLRAAVRRRVGMFPPETVRIERSVLGDRAGILGAVALANGL